MGVRASLFSIGCCAIALACGPAKPAANASDTAAAAMLPDVRFAKDRPPVILVSRAGDPSAALAIAIATGGVGEGGAGGPADDDAEVAVAIAGLVEARLAARGLAATVVPSWSGVRASLLVPEGRAANVVETLTAALAAKADEKDLAAAKKKLDALAARPLPDLALARWARCVGSPYAMPARVARAADIAIDRLEQWRSRAIGLGRVMIGVAGTSDTAEGVARAIEKGNAWKQGAAAPPAPAVRQGSIEPAVYDSTPEAPPTVHVTLDVGAASFAVAAAEALGDPRGPLASRLASLDLPFRLREVTGAVDARGGCVGVVLEANGVHGATTSDLATRVADAVALVQLEASTNLSEGGALLDGRTLARRAGDAREAAERAAWWALADSWGSPREKNALNSRFAMANGSAALGIPTRKGSTPGSTGPTEPTRDALGAAITRATAAWLKPVAESRVRVEPGQGEAWVLVASPCGTDAETDADAGLTALVTMAAAETARSSADARVEPWIVPDGAGLLVHGPALMGETPAAQAHRLADVAARSFASDALTPVAIARARANLMRPEARATTTPALSALAAAIAPGHPSWFFASGRDETIARVADSAITSRALALRSGPLRVAVIANVDTPQGEAAVRAADRWIDRRGEAARACRAGASSAPRPGTYAVEPRGGGPEAILAYPFADDDRARGAATTIAAALDGDGGMLEKAVGAAGLARSWSARVIGAPRAPALVIRIASSQESLDKAVMQTRALVDRIRTAGLAAADYDRAAATTARDAVANALDPRARVVATFRAEPIPNAAQPPPPRATADETRAFATKALAEDQLVVIAARPGRPPAPAPASTTPATTPAPAPPPAKATTQ